MKILTNVLFKGEFSPAFMNRCYETFLPDIDGIEIVWKRGSKTVDSFMKSNQGVILRNGKKLLSVGEKGHGVLYLKSVEDKEPEIFHHIKTLDLLSERKSVKKGTAITLVYIMIIFVIAFVHEDIDQTAFRFICSFCTLLIAGCMIAYSAVSNQAGHTKINPGLILAFIAMLGLAPLSLVNLYLLSAIRDKYFYERMKMFTGPE